MEDNTGKVHWMEAVGVGSITDSVPLHDEAAVRREFPGIREGAVRRPVGAAGLLISMTERQLHSQGGIEKGKLRLSKTPLGCGQVLTGVAKIRREANKRERQRAECGATQRETDARPVQGRSFHALAFRLVVTKGPHRPETATQKKKNHRSLRLPNS